MIAAAQSGKSPTTHVMGVAKFERFFRIAAGLRPARGRAARMPMVSPFQIRIGNPTAAITASASITNGSTFPTMR